MKQDNVSDLYAGEREEKLRKVRFLKSLRDARASLFGPTLFSDPPWEILLTLFAAELEGGTVRSADLFGCINSVPSSTLFRWLDSLYAKDWIAREECDGHEVVRLSLQGSAAMHALFEIVPGEQLL